MNLLLVFSLTLDLVGYMQTILNFFKSNVVGTNGNKKTIINHRARDIVLIFVIWMFPNQIQAYENVESTKELV